MATANSIKCTYDNCNLYFATEKAMKRHKYKDAGEHYYCKRCDVDCPDDRAYLIHQITSDRHLSCPICGREFHTVRGREEHVETDHVAKQKMNCAGCNKLFESPARFMRHIEFDGCSVIRSSHFLSQRAEKKIMADVYESMTAPNIGPVRLMDSDISKDAPSMIKQDAGGEQERVWVETDWRGSVIGRGAGNGELQNKTESVVSRMTNLSLDNFPPLQPGPRMPAQGPRNMVQPEPDLIDFSTPPESSNTKMSGAPVQQSRDTVQALPCRTRQAPDDLIQFEDQCNPIPRTSTKHSNHNGQIVMTDDKLNTIIKPHTSLTGFGTDNQHRHITTATRVQIPSQMPMYEYYDEILQVYQCPKQGCTEQFHTLGDFRGHLLSPVHTPEFVQCPGCYKRFNTTTALVAHCSSASRKCRIRHCSDYDSVMRKITAGLISAGGYQEDGSIKYTAEKIENW